MGLFRPQVAHGLACRNSSIFRELARNSDGQRYRRDWSLGYRRAVRRFGGPAQCHRRRLGPHWQQAGPD